MHTKHLVAALFACAAVPAFAQPATGCNVSGAWIIRQSNGAVAEMDVRRGEGNALIGAGSEGNQTGAMTGEIDGRNVEFTIAWRPNKAVGVYQGRISRSGDRMMGTTYNQSNPRDQATWVVERRFSNCP